MSKEDNIIKANGNVTKVEGHGNYKVRLEGSDHIVLCSLNGKLRQNRISVLLGDAVEIEMSPTDLTRGRIIYRFKKGQK